MRLRSLDSDAATQYLTHRIRRVGGSPAILDSTALPLLIERAGGIPRRLNTIADNALFEAFLAGRVSATADDVSRAADELELGEGAGAPRPRPRRGAPARREGGPRAAAPARRAPATQDLDSVFDHPPTGPRRDAARPILARRVTRRGHRLATPSPGAPGGKAGKPATAFSGRGRPGQDHDPQPRRVPRPRVRRRLRPQHRRAAGRGPAKDEEIDDLFADIVDE